VYSVRLSVSKLAISSKTFFPRLVRPIPKSEEVRELIFRNLAAIVANINSTAGASSKAAGIARLRLDRSKLIEFDDQPFARRRRVAGESETANQLNLSHK
jgi:hypothetical protein